MRKLTKPEALVIDDHPAIRVAVRHTVERLGLFSEVREADSGTDALTKFRIHPALLVVLDLDLPGMDGLDLIRRLRASNREAKFLVYSGLDEEIYAVRAQKAGANGFISKLRPIELIETAAHSILNGIDCFPAAVFANGSRPDADAIHKLSNREMMILSHLIKGRSNKDIAIALCIDAKTVSTYKRRILDKTGAKNLVELLRLCREQWDME
ncbi:MAG: response regulator transcription factor [Candidatus Protistobacter heckmanni]|nr:response regulator transcription factor [Candidatus Protistobacter heckmanni]